MVKEVINEIIDRASNKKHRHITSYYRDPIMIDDDLACIDNDDATYDDDFACIDDDLACHECHCPDDCDNCSLDCDRYHGMTTNEYLAMRREEAIAARFVSLLKARCLYYDYTRMQGGIII